jgi:hypothetical protein
MGIFDRFKSKKNDQKVHEAAGDLNKAAATGDTKKVGAAVGKSEKTTTKIERKTQIQSNKQSGKLDKQFDRSDAAANAFLENENTDPNADETDRLIKEMQQKSFPDVPKSPVAIKKAQQAPARQQVQQAPVKQAQARPKQQTQHQINKQQHQARMDRLHVKHAEKTGKLKQAQQHWEAVTANASSGKENANPNAGKIAPLRQEKQIKTTPARPPQIKAEDLPAVPTSPVTANKAQQDSDKLEELLENESLLTNMARKSPDEQRLDQKLMDEFEQDEPEPQTAKQALEEMLMNEFDSDEPEAIPDDDWEQELQDELDAENKTPKPNQ